MKKIALYGAVAVFAVMVLGVSAHATAGAPPHTFSECFSCGLCELLHNWLAE